MSYLYVFQYCFVVSFSFGEISQQFYHLPPAHTYGLNRSLWSTVLRTCTYTLPLDLWYTLVAYNKLDYRLRELFRSSCSTSISSLSKSTMTTSKCSSWVWAYICAGAKHKIRTEISYRWPVWNVIVCLVHWVCTYPCMSRALSVYLSLLHWWQISLTLYTL